MSPSTTPSESADILVVDDTPSILQMLTITLESAGYKVRPVGSGALALQAAWKQPPDLILLDINMPDMDGYEVCKCLKANAILKDIPVIFISGLNDTEGQVKALKCGGVDYITKPFRGEDVKSRVKVNLDLPHQQRLLQQSKQQPQEGAEKAERQLRILVAEDNPVNQEVVRMFLTKHGHDILIVSDGSQAVAAAAAETFDVILMDIQMPGMDGIEASTAIHEAQAASGQYTPIVALTAFSMKKDKERCIKAGMDRFITKPFTRSNLLDTIYQVVEERRRR